MTALRSWLWIVAVLIMAMVVVGGATRLTESGLSITQWKPISGVIPPLSTAEWEAEFARYREIPQYAQLFPDMSLAGFKSIFWWEWSHRLLGRLIGFVVALPLAWFWITGRLTRDLKWKLTGLLLLGGLQGVIGWWMVKSGLSERTEVSQYRLALHLLTASATLALTVWFAESLTPMRRAAAGWGVRFVASMLLLGVFLQLGLGALVAGLRAGLIYGNWPWMGDSLVPPADEVLARHPLWHNVFENPVTAQLDHRLMAYLLLAGALAHVIQCRRSATAGSPAPRTALALLVALLVQASLGIATLLYSVPLGTALLHQLVAMVVLVVAVTHRCGLRRRRVPVLRAVPSSDPTAEVIGFAGFATRSR